MATVKGIQEAAQNRDPMPPLPPQICCPNSFAMAELTHVAGLVTKDNVKSGAAHPSMMPTCIIFDTTLSRGLPDWVRFGTALRGVEHAIGAICHPNATADIRTRALEGLEFVNKGLKGMVENADSEKAQVNCYLGGWMAIRALNTGGCYPSIAHLIQNHYSARFHVHQGSCSGILSAEFCIIIGRRVCCINCLLHEYWMMRGVIWIENNPCLLQHSLYQIWWQHYQGWQRIMLMPTSTWMRRCCEILQNTCTINMGKS